MTGATGDISGAITAMLTVANEFNLGYVLVAGFAIALAAYVVRRIRK